MASNPKEPLSNHFVKDIAHGKRSNFNVGYKNRFSADFCYLYPVGLWDVPADSHFVLDMHSVLSSNPTLAPVLGKLKFRAEAYFVEKAAYVQMLRDNEKVPVDRNVPFPVVSSSLSKGLASVKSSITEFLQMYPSGWNSSYINGSSFNDATPSLNAIPLIMYYDIYRNYYVNPQDDNIPIRNMGYVPPINVADPGSEPDYEYYPIEDVYVTRAALDGFVHDSRDSQDVGQVYDMHFGFSLLPRVSLLANNVVSEFHHKRYAHHGLMRRTLNNDFFTSFISNDNVELMKRYSKVNSVMIDGANAFTVEQIALANRNWRLATRSLLWGTDWKDFNKVHYGVDLLIPYGKPQFLGSLSSDVVFNDVISQAQTGDNSDDDVTANTNLASRAGLAFGALRNSDKKHFVEFNTKDEGYVMVLISLTPEVDYYQGIDPMYFKKNLQHSWMLELNSVGMQDFHRAWASVVPPNNPISNVVSWEQLNSAIWQVPIWFEYMAKYNQLHGDFTADFLNRYWVFSRPFDGLGTLFDKGVFSDPTEPFDTDFNGSTYGLPEMFNYIFANVAGSDNFQIQVRFDARLNCMLDKQVISYL